jgi:cell division protein FtsB
MITKKSKKRKSLQDTLFPALFVLLAVALGAFLIISNLRIGKKRGELTSQIDALKKEIQILEEKKEQLQAGVSQTQSESFLEQEARERLGLQKPGEEVVAIKKVESEVVEEPQEKSFWQKVWDKITFWRD